MKLISKLVNAQDELPYSIRINALDHLNAYRWCVENYGRDSQALRWDFRPCDPTGGLTYLFSNEKEAAFFALNWSRQD